MCEQVVPVENYIKHLTMKLKSITFLLLAVLLFGCGTPSVNKPAETKNDDSLKNNTGATSNMELLQGKWQSTDDNTNFLVFEKDHRKEIAEGMENWDDEVFVLSDRCLNESDKGNNIPAEKDRYISCSESDLCWYIISLDSETLSLSYMSRGNTLTYKKVKE